MFYGGIVLPTPPPAASSINLQATLAAASAGGEPVFPHHPITCSAGSLSIYDDGVLECEHGRTGAGDDRTQACVDATIAILLFELVHEKYGSTPRS